MAKSNKSKQTPKTKTTEIKLGKAQNFAAELAPRTKPPKKTGDKK